MNILRIYGISLLVSAILCVIFYDVIGVSTGPLNILCTFLGLIHLFALIQAGILVMNNEKLFDYLKLSTDKVINTMLISVTVCVILSGFVYYLTHQKNAAFWNLTVTGLAFGIVKGLTSKSRNSTSWCLIVMAPVITYFILDSVFVLNFELLALMLIIINGDKKKCPGCGTWWSLSLLNQTVLKENRKPKTGSYTRRVTGRGTGRDAGRDVEMEITEFYTYYIYTRLYREDYQCKACGHHSSREVWKRKGLFGDWTSFYF